MKVRDALATLIRQAAMSCLAVALLGAGGAMARTDMAPGTYPCLGGTQLTNVNELNMSSAQGQANFLEIKILNFQSVLNSAKLCYTAKAGSGFDSICNQLKSSAVKLYRAGTYMGTADTVTPMATNDYLVLDLPNGTNQVNEVILVDSSNNVIDYIQICTNACSTGYWTTNPGTCGYQLANVGSNVKDVARFPTDGTGTWTANTINSSLPSTGTTGSTNAGSATLNHVEFVHDGSAVTCVPKAITVLGCTGSAICNGVSGSQYSSGSFAVTLATISGATWCSDAACATPISGAQTLSNNQTLYLRQTTATTTTPTRLAGTASGATTTAVQCVNSTAPTTLNATTACDVTYSSAGFIFDVPDHVAEVAQTVNVSAVRQSDNATVCVPAFQSVSKNVTFKCTYTNPSATSFVPVRVGGAALNSANDAAAVCDAGGRAVSLSFNASGVASTTFQYADVGQMGLTATYTGSGGDAGLTMTGSDSFKAAPKDFAFSGITAGPIAAGNAFSATVTARNASGDTTRNFGKESPSAETVTLSLGGRVAPTGTNDCTNGPCDGAVAGSVGSWNNGQASASNLTYSEVGQMTLQATLTSGSYLSSGLTATGTSATVGDFVPAYFDTTVTQGCGTAFTYSAQPFRVDVTAKRVGGGTTVNYSNLSGCTVCAKAVTLSDPTATTYFNGTNTLAATAFAKGVGSSSTVKYTLPSATTVPAAITLRAVDATVTPNVTSSGHTEGTTTVRSGRLRLVNANGSELLALPVTARVEYYQSTTQAWQLSTGDTCTTLAASDFAFSFPNASGNNLYSASAGVCETRATVSGSPPSPTVSLSAPGAGNNGWADLTLNLGAAASGNQCTTVCTTACTAVPATTSNKPWLQFDWKGAGAANPTARATFGVYRSGPVIHRREMY